MTVPLVWRVAQGIGREVLQRLFETIGIAGYELRSIGDVGHDLKAAFKTLPLVPHAHALEQRLDLDPPEDSAVVTGLATQTAGAAQLSTSPLLQFGGRGRGANRTATTEDSVGGRARKTWGSTHLTFLTHPARPTPADHRA